MPDNLIRRKDTDTEPTATESTPTEKAPAMPMNAQEFVRICHRIYHPGYKRWRYLVADQLGCSYQAMYRMTTGIQPVSDSIAAEVRGWEQTVDEIKAKYTTEGIGNNAQ